MQHNIFCFIVTGVAAEWVDESFTSLRVTFPEGGTYRISYSAVSKRKVLEPRVVTTRSSSQVVKDFIPDYFYTILIEAGNDYVEKGKQFPIVANVTDNSYLTLTSHIISVTKYRNELLRDVMHIRHP